MWESWEIPEEVLRARVVMIYKKGDTSSYENYTPISLLNSIYKLIAAILQRRIAKGVDKHLQKRSSDSERTRAQQMHYILSGG